MQENDKTNLPTEIQSALKDCRLDHVAIAVKDLEAGKKIYELLGLNFSNQMETVESQKVKTLFASIDEHAHLELLEPLNGEGPIQKFLETKGEGIHHLSFQVNDIRKKMAELKAQGIKLLYEEPTLGANNMLVNFIHPKSGGGVLIEIAEKNSLQ